MTTRTETLLPYFDLVPKDLLDRSVIAGGAVVDLKQAHDVDLWILAPEDVVDQRAYCENLRSQLRSHYEHINQNNDENRLFVYGVKERKLDEPEYCSDGRVLFEISTNLSVVNVQVLLTKFTTVPALLRHFDLSVHQAALIPSGEIIVVPTTTKTNEPIDITNFSTPDTTFRRYRKLYHRYGAVRPYDMSGMIRLLLERPSEESDELARDLEGGEL